MNKQQLKELTQKDVVDKYYAYHKGLCSKEEYTLFLLDIMKNYIVKLVTPKLRATKTPFEDLLQAGYLAVIEKIDEYDPTKAMPSSFFTPHINSSTFNAGVDYDEKVLKGHYLQAKRRMDKAAIEYGYKGVLDERLDPVTLSIISGEPEGTVVTVLELLKLKANSLDALTDNFDTHLSKNPLEEYLAKEERAFCSEQLAKCSPLERYLLEVCVMDEEPASFNNLVKLLKTPKYRELFKDELPSEKGITQIKLRQVLNQAIRRIKNDPSTKKFKKDRYQDNSSEPEEQATVYDIEEAFACDAI